MFSIVSGDTSAFAVDQTSGTISSRRVLDREENASYELTIKAMDGSKLIDKAWGIDSYIYKYKFVFLFNNILVSRY